MCIHGCIQIALRLVEHFYYKTDAVYSAMRKLAMQQRQADAAAAAAAAAEKVEAAEAARAAGEEVVEAGSPDDVEVCGSRVVNVHAIRCVVCIMTSAACTVAASPSISLDVLPAHLDASKHSSMVFTTVQACFSSTGLVGVVISSHTCTVPSCPSQLKVPADYEINESCSVAMQALVTGIYKEGDERTKARAMLCHIYHR